MSYPPLPGRIEITPLDGRQAIERRADAIIRAKASALNGGTLLIGIPGGRSIAGIVRAIAAMPPEILAVIRLQLIDERLSGRKNIETLLEAGLGQVIAEGRMRRNQIAGLDPDGTAGIEKPFDILFAGVGEDGHFASLFPGSLTRYGDTEDPVIVVKDSPKPPPQRITVSFPGFRKLTRGSDAYLLFLGEGKREALTAFLKEDNPDTVPCTFFKRLDCTVTILTDLDFPGKEQS